MSSRLSNAHAVVVARLARFALPQPDMKTPIGMVALVMVSALVVGGCRHTYDGAKADTKRAVQKTGQGVEKAGEKIEGAGEKK